MTTLRDALLASVGAPRVKRLFAEAHERVIGGANADADLAPPGQAVPPSLTPGVPGPMLEEAVRLLTEAQRPVVLAGPGVVLDDMVPGLHAFAAAGSLGVVNTWGAKGVFDWESPHHLATVGLQADDFALAGLHDADVVLAVGIDELEAPAARWRMGQVLDLRPDDLAPLASRWRRAPADIPVPPLRTLLAAVTEHGWMAHDGPVWPSGATLDYARALGPDGLVAADPGVAGFWVARTFPTRRPRSVHVSARNDRHGLAVACAVVARLERPERRVLVAVDAPMRPEVRAVLEVARDLGVPVGVEVWDADARLVTRDEHEARLGELVTVNATRVETVAPARAQLDEIVEAAGPVIAWSGGS